MSAVPVTSKNWLDFLDDFRYSSEQWGLHNWT